MSQSTAKSCPKAYGGKACPVSNNDCCPNGNCSGKSTNFRLCNVTQKNFMASKTGLKCHDVGGNPVNCTNSAEICQSGYNCIVLSNATFNSGTPVIGNYAPGTFTNQLTMSNGNKIACVKNNILYTPQPNPSNTKPSGGGDGPCG